MLAVDLLAGARSAIRQKNPYFLGLIHGLVPYETTEVKTLGVTPGMVVYYNPAFIESLLKEAEREVGPEKRDMVAISKTSFALLHEGNHPLRKHFDRRGNRDPKLWNRATDLGINSDLRAMGWLPPSIAIFPAHYGLPDGLTAEQYYDLLEKQQKEQQGGGSGGTKNKEGQQGDSQGEEEGESACAGHCGGGAGNAEKDALEKKIDEEVGRSDADRERIEKQVASDVNQHINQHGRGNIPGTFSEWAHKALKPPTVRWEKALRHALHATCGRIESGGHDYSFSRISKRSFVRRLIRPGLVSFMPEGAIILDVSGSMDTKQIGIGLRETGGVLAGLGLDRIWFLQADARVTTAPEFVRTRDLRHMKIVGRGGTDFTAAIDAVSQLRPRPNFIVYFTDGDGHVPPNPPPGISVIWAIVPGHHTQRPPCSWGKVIWIKE